MPDNNFSKRLADGVSVSVTETTGPRTQIVLGKDVKRMPRHHQSSLSRAMFASMHDILVAPDDKGNLKKTPQQVMLAELESGNNYQDKVSQDTSLSIRQSRDIMSALPDIELAMRLKVCSILSPNDMISKELIYSCGSAVFGDTTKLLLEIVEGHFESSYKIKEQLTDMLNKALFTEGSYVKVVLPTSSIDDAINSNLIIATGTEAIDYSTIGNESRGFIEKLAEGTEDKLSELLGVVVSDDFDICKIPALRRRRNKNRTAKTLYPGLLSATHYEGEEGTDSVYPKRKDSEVNVLTLKSLKDLEKSSVGHPVDLTIPPEAFIPVHRPSDPTYHEGGFLLLDETGNPVRNRNDSDQQGQMQAGHAESIQALTAGLIEASGDPMLESDSTSTKGGVVDEKYMATIYSTLLEKQLREKLEKGDYQDGNVDVGLHQEVARVMLSRTLKQLKTKLVYVPKELVSYLAFDYNDNGRGRGLIEKTKTISSMRMVQEVADAIANVRNAIDHKDATIKLDPADETPMKTLNDVLHNIQNSMMAATPLGSLNMNDIAKNFQLHGWNIRTEGHEGMPDMSVEYNQSTRNYPKPDTTYADRLRDQQTMAMGLSPDSVSGLMDADLATAIISNNIFLARDALDNQEIFSAFLTDFVQKYTINSSVLVEELTKVIEANRKIITAAEKYPSKLLAILFINNLKIELPQPDLSKLDMQKKALDTYSSMIDSVMEYFVTEEAFSSETLGEEPGQAMQAIKQIIKEAAMRKYIADNNITPELFELIYGGAYTSDKLSVLKAHQNSCDHLAPVITQWLTRNKLRRHKADKLNSVISENITGDGSTDNVDYSGSTSGDTDEVNVPDGDTDGTEDLDIDADGDTTEGEGDDLGFEDIDELENINLGEDDE